MEFFKLFRFLLRIISMKCYYNVRNAFQSSLLKYGFYKVCFEARKIRSPFFSCLSLLLSTSVLNDITGELKAAEARNP